MNEEKKESVELSKDAQGILDKIKKLSVMDLSNLVKGIEEEFDVSAAAPAMMAAGPVGAAGGGAEAAAEKTEFDLVLKAAGGQKIAVIKAVKELTGSDLKSSKALVDGVPAKIKEKISKEEAEEGKKKLEEAGAEASVE